MSSVPVAQRVYPLYTCLHCGSHGTPVPGSESAPGAIWLAAILFCSCILASFAWVPFLAMRRYRRYCPDCGQPVE